jgi:hypothetical protein
MSTENIVPTYAIERLDHLGIVAGMIINGLGFSNRVCYANHPTAASNSLRDN